MLILLFRLITHHSAPHKKVTAIKDGHAFTQDLINWRSRVLVASDAPQSDGLGSGKERSRDAGGISGRLFCGNVNKCGGGVTGLVKRSWSTVANDAIFDEAEVWTYFSVRRFENLGSMDSMCWYKVYQLALNNENIPQRVVASCVPRRQWPNRSPNVGQMDQILRRLT